MAVTQRNFIPSVLILIGLGMFAFFGFSRSEVSEFDSPSNQSTPSNGTAVQRDEAAIDEIACTNSASYGLTNDQAHQYLEHNLHFHLGHAEKRGLELYFQHAADLNIIAPNLQLQFHDCQTAG